MLSDPAAIEEKSLAIIEAEIGPHRFSPLELAVVKRAIHATADFDFARNMIFHRDAVQAGIDAVRLGAEIVADVQMVEVGISKDRLRKFGGAVWCFISDQDVISEAKQKNLTRAIVSMQKAVAAHPNGVYVIGNAPTALLELIRLVEEKKARPALIIGVPVGFVSAAESKEKLASLTDIPFITCR
ncbi:MAG TPA: precorrin-8X methylmutase, partial [Nitrospiria bacterium]|nr:precorrin-8X methylmutase [Nitrospiria bacterium]